MIINSQPVLVCLFMFPIIVSNIPTLICYPFMTNCMDLQPLFAVVDILCLLDIFLNAMNRQVQEIIAIMFNDINDQSLIQNWCPTFSFSITGSDHHELTMSV